jgi:hypothetical protein
MVMTMLAAIVAAKFRGKTEMSFALTFSELLQMRFRSKSRDNQPNT